MPELIFHWARQEGKAQKQQALKTGFVFSLVPQCMGPTSTFNDAELQRLYHVRCWSRGTPASFMPTIPQFEPHPPINACSPTCVTRRCFKTVP